MEIVFSSLLRMCNCEGHENEEEFELNELHQLLVYADDGSLWNENINIVQNNKRSDKRCYVAYLLFPA